MSMKEAVTHVFQNYATFSGRARRSEYWYFALFIGLVSLVLGILGAATGKDGQPGTVFSLLSGLWSLATLIPNLAVFWRRMHDIGKSGAWYFLGFVPLVGAIVLLVWCCKDSQPGDNQFGSNPKETVYTY